ncbi:MAG: transglutaminase-like domain-containing protein [Pseudomonadales bacterium]
MIRIELQVELNYQVDAYGADFLFNVHAAQTPSQVVAAERLTLSQDVMAPLYTEPGTGNRRLLLHAEPGELHLSYRATVDLIHHFADPERLDEVPVRALPPEVIGYIYPSRYCQSDRLLRMASDEFGMLSQGYSRVQAIRDWVHQHVAYTSNTTNSNTSAVDTLVERVGVCRDFAHLMIALCRAVNIPARFVTGTNFGSDGSLGPPDFHAYVEAYLGDRWYLFDPSGLAIPMGLVRVGTGRDAADVAFATIFGNVLPRVPLISAVAVEDAAADLVLPFRSLEALSTDSAGKTVTTSAG